jgi:hypothetical protein
MEQLLLELKREPIMELALELKFRDPTWSLFLETLTPNQYGSLLAQISSRRLRVAVLLARRHGRFECQHVRAAIDSDDDCWNLRPLLVEMLLPYVTDNNIGANHQVIQAGLNEWERMVTQAAFDHALATSRASDYRETKKVL